MSGIISWLSFPPPLPPVVTMEGRRGLKGFQRVCVCVRAHVQAFVFTFFHTPPLIFCDSIASVWVCAASWPTEGCESVCRSFSCILRDENTTKKKNLSLTLQVVLLRYDSLLISRLLVHLKKVSQFDNNISIFFFLFWGGILAFCQDSQRGTKLLLGTATVSRVRVAVSLTCAKATNKQHSVRSGHFSSLCEVRHRSWPTSRRRSFQGIKV